MSTDPGGKSEWKNTPLLPSASTLKRRVRSKSTYFCSVRR